MFDPTFGLSIFSDIGDRGYSIRSYLGEFLLPETTCGDRAVDNFNRALSTKLEWPRPVGAIKSEKERETQGLKLGLLSAGTDEEAADTSDRVDKATRI